MRYIHLLFDAHEVIFAEGIPSESFLPTGANRALHPEATAEMEALLSLAAVRPELRARDAVLLVK